MNRTTPLLICSSLIFTLPLVSQAPASPAKPASPPVRKPATAAGPKLPPGVPVVHGVVKTAFSLRYEEIKLGTGKPAEPGMIYTVQYTGWLASNGTKFDSSYDHRRPVLDKDGKPEKDADGKPKLGEPEPFQFQQGNPRLIPGWNTGFAGMKVGGKRRLFIPYQLAYGVRGVPGRDADHPGIPPSSDLIFDMELMNVEPAPANMPGAPRAPGLGRPVPPLPRPGAPGAAPNNAPGTPPPPTGAPATQPTTPPRSNAPVKPVDPTAPTTAPNSAPPPPTPAPTQPPATNPTAPPDKPANPEQPPA